MLWVITHINHPEKGVGEHLNKKKFGHFGNFTKGTKDPNHITILVAGILATEDDA